MNDWPAAWAFLSEHEWGADPEGGLTHDPADPGGVTRWGISQRAHPELDVEHLSRESAEVVYLSGYWGPLQAAAMPAAVALTLFDWAVHSGRALAVRALQKILGLDPTGKISLAEMTAIGKLDPLALAIKLLHARAKQQAVLYQANPALLRFASGWTARLLDLCATVAQLPS